MEKFMTKHRNIIITVSYLCLMVIFFSLGLFIGFKNGDEQLTKNVSSTVNNIPDKTEIPAQNQSPSNYRLVLEDGELRLYVDEGGKSRLISAEAISEDTYPVADIALLKKGIIFESADSAVSMLENFIS